MSIGAGSACLRSSGQPSAGSPDTHRASRATFVIRWVLLARVPEYLKEFGILSATTCKSGLCTADTNPLLLPRLVDTTGTLGSGVSRLASGTATLVPARRYEMSEGQLVEDEELAAQ